MSGLVPLLLGAWAAVVPDGFLVARALAASRVEPVRALAPAAAATWLVHHHVDALPMAFYLPPAPLPAGVAVAASAGGEARVLPALALPRLVLYAPYYRPARPVDELAVDTREYLLHAVLEARLDAAVGADEPYLAAAAARAATLLDDLPEAGRRAAYLAAAADFGSHLLGLAVELHRSAARRRAAGKAPCPAEEVGLVAHWRAAFETTEFRFHLGGEGAGGVTSRRALGPEDKRLFVDGVLGVAWRGDAAADLQGLCGDGDGRAGR